MKTKIFLTFSVLFCLLFSSCTVKELEEFKKFVNEGPEADKSEGQDKEQKRKEPLLVCAVSFHEVIRYPREDDTEKELDDLNGKNVVVNIKPIIHTRYVKKVEIKQIKGASGACDLGVYLDKKGKMLWGQICFSSKYREVAMVVDGTVYRRFYPEHLDADSKDKETFLLVRGPFTQSAADSVVLHSEENYKKLNP